MKITSIASVQMHFKGILLHHPKISV